ncbi:MAG TPA: N-formylglutamate deformylase [Erwinia persicina]|uniref:N-formylglutamate deformylase n=1 Tax=Erwinia persicina TaxID=55211 RepID=A0A357U2N5_9GAMM|nr:N-formylglutamate deformylase [Erwinia persicina]AXU95810.1 N-formylglutamate deformylase [Erwinia persicina]MBC3945485.1 N-formylglutamate deformylase [Erwinia persicina]MCQ4093027.1 N-formylglutamate deformylase [Erwinia persicina]MCQ4100366.1 N-formylglutamate deformylase [Erwinia persicina]MCQ4106165.1 N-formylglutamate deformylase [Erwinia persicina]
MNAFQFSAGTLPLLLSIPHAGTQLTPEVEAGLSEAARGLPDTDWHIPQLYDFAREMGISVLVGNYSRFVIDLNRPPDNQALYTTATTGLYPETLFDGTPTFIPGKTPTPAQREGYLHNIWQPYHNNIQQELARLKQQHGYALLFDAHSIASVIPRLFDGQLPDMNLGTNDGVSCSTAITRRLTECCQAQSAFSWVLNGRFKGGYITRAYGRPEAGQHAIQLELAQCNYMDEQPPFGWREDKAARLQPLLRQLIGTLLKGPH